MTVHQQVPDVDARVALEPVADADELATLRVLKRRILQELDVTRSARDVASLASRLQEVTARIGELVREKKDVEAPSAADQLAARRARRSAAPVAAGDLVAGGESGGGGGVRVQSHVGRRAGRREP